MNDLLDFARISPYLTRALEYTGSPPTHSLDDLQAGCEQSRFQLWPGQHSAVITELLSTPRLTTLNFFLAGGQMDELKRLHPLILAWGKSQGCQRAILLGRPGWARSFLTKEDGWVDTGMRLLEKRLTDE